jgi:imidazoleglycerol-phosphate dehydratase
MSTSRKAEVKRKTGETDISLSLNLDGEGRFEIDTGIPFFNHMLDLLARHALFDLTLKAVGDLEVDYHHTVEDVGLALGEALDKALAERVGICRYGWCVVPMDESLARVAVDLGGRPHLVYKMAVRKRRIRDFDLWLLKHFFESLSQKARMNLHIEQMYGEDAHHAYEAVFKGVAQALRGACAIDPRVKGVPSSKGVL